MVQSDKAKPPPRFTCQIHLGAFAASAADAARAFDKAALMLRGKGARINFRLEDYLDGNGNVAEDPDIRDRINKYLK